MQTLKNIAISIGDLNGVGFEIILKAHDTIKTLCNPVYCINSEMAEQAAALLQMKIPSDFVLSSVDGNFIIQPGIVDSDSGQYSYDSFVHAIELAKNDHVDAITTLPIHKESWMKAGITYKGHTDALRDILHSDAIMMLGCEELYVALFTEHIPLRDVIKHINTEEISDFLIRLYNSLQRSPIAVLGVNPHAGDNGVLGDEEVFIVNAISRSNSIIGKEVFIGPIVPDVAFTPYNRKRYPIIAAMYHDQGLGPLKALYFDQSINVSLGLPIVRTSVDHGTAFDIAYQLKASVDSYIESIKSAVSFALHKEQK